MTLTVYQVSNAGLLFQFPRGGLAVDCFCRDPQKLYPDTSPGMRQFLMKEIREKRLNVLIFTHEHGDHFYLPDVLEAWKENPELLIISNQAVGSALRISGIPGENPITTTPEDGYFFADAAKIEACIDDKTRAICLPAPGNPTGRTLTLDDIRLICQVAEKHDLWIIADEVYREFVYDGNEMTSFGMLPEYADRVVIVDSISKRYSSCGARIGFIVTKNKDMQEGLMKIAQGRLCVPTLEQIGATELFKLPKSYYDEVCAEYESRRDAAYEEISKIPGVVCQKPGGSFYLMAKLPIDNAEDFLLFMLEEFEHNGETVMFTPAEGFYATEGLGKEEIRIAYVLKAEDMARSAELIRLGIEAYNNR